ncbi:hypothetical protein Tco_0444553 [Tanacetum coccineum]
MASQDARLSKFEADFKQQQCEMTNKINTVLKAITDRMAGALPSDTVKNPKLNVNYTSPVSFARSYPTEDLDDGDVMFIEIIKENDDSYKEEPEVRENAGVGELEVEYFDILMTRSNGYFTKRQKTKQNGQNQAREWKECEKTKPKSYTIGGFDVEGNQGSRSLDLWRFGLKERD